jgi:3-phosphoshikimate 1-carboxyvinyltransferase
VIFSSLARGRIKIKNFLFAQDALATIDCFRKMGVVIKTDQKNKSVTISSRGRNFLKEPKTVLDVGNSGTTIRILTGLLSGLPFKSTITGDDSIKRRPMKRVVEPLRRMGADIAGQRKNNDIFPPLVIRGRPLHGITYNLPVASAQVKSALLLAGLNAHGVTEIKEPAPSRDHTERMFAYFGCKLKRRNGFLQVDNCRELSGKNLEIPGDFSSAAFFMVAALILPRSTIILKKVGINPGRVGLLEVLEKMGARIKIKNMRYFGREPVADLEVRSSKLWGIEISGRIIPKIIDEIPILAVAAIFASGHTVIKDAAELRVKESDRIAAIASEFKKMGAVVSERPDGLIIKGTGQIKGAVVSSRGDHRIAMSLAVAALRARGRTTIKNTACIETSFPEFTGLLKKVLKKK